MPPNGREPAAPPLGLCPLGGLVACQRQAHQQLRSGHVGPSLGSRVERVGEVVGLSHEVTRTGGRHGHAPGSRVADWWRESAHEQAWRARVAAAADGCSPTSSVALHFRLELRRRVDLDNLVGPALAGLRDAGVYARGFPDLHGLIATKTTGETPGLAISLERQEHPGTVPAPGLTALVAASSALPHDGDRSSKVAWREQVRRCYDGEPVADPVWLNIAVRARGSLEALLKPIIDGLEPLLGRDSRGQLELVPNDDLVVWLRVTRQPDLPCALVLAAGPSAA